MLTNYTMAPNEWRQAGNPLRKAGPPALLNISELLCRIVERPVCAGYGQTSLAAYVSVALLAFSLMQLEGTLRGMEIIADSGQTRVEIPSS